MVGISGASIYHVEKILRLKSVSKHVGLFEGVLSYILRKPSPRPGYTCIAGLEDIAMTENGQMFRHEQDARCKKE